MRREKGITLVALILTVVVLLILAVVSINAIQDTQIINYASNAGQAWNDAQRNENGFLQTYNQYLGNYSGTGNSGTTTPTTVTFTITCGEDVRTYTAINGQTMKSWLDGSTNAGWDYMIISYSHGDDLHVFTGQDDSDWGFHVDLTETISANENFTATQPWS